MFPLVVHQSASASIWPAVQSLWQGLPTNPGVKYGAYVGAVELCRVCECYRGDIVVMDVIWRRLCVNVI